MVAHHHSHALDDPLFRQMRESGNHFALGETDARPNFRERARHQRQPLLNRPDQRSFGWLRRRRPVQRVHGGGTVFCVPCGIAALPMMRLHQVEAKIKFVWIDDAYTKGEWKESPEFRGITVEYEQEPVIHVHEEK